MAGKYAYPNSGGKRYKTNRLTGGVDEQYNGDAYKLLRIGLFGDAATPIAGTGTGTQPVQSMAADGLLKYVGDAAMDQAVQSMAATGYLEYAGTGDMAQPAQSMVADGSVEGGAVVVEPAIRITPNFRLEWPSASGRGAMGQPPQYLDGYGDTVPATVETVPESEELTVYPILGVADMAAPRSSVRARATKGPGILTGTARMGQGPQSMAGEGTRDMREKNARELMTIMWLSRAA
jgi:hypothetical protein